MSTAANLNYARDRMVGEIVSTIQNRGLKQAEAARVCRTDAPSFSKVLRGKSRQVSLEKLASWLAALGRKVTIQIESSFAGDQPVDIVLNQAANGGEIR